MKRSTHQAIRQAHDSLLDVVAGTMRFDIPYEAGREIRTKILAVRAALMDAAFAESVEA